MLNQQYRKRHTFLPQFSQCGGLGCFRFPRPARLEMRRLKNVGYETDRKAFVFAHTIRVASGGILKRQIH
jgi:hypothetical protein